MADKPRVRFCWHCSRRLRLPSYVEKRIDGHLRILHKQCARNPGLIFVPVRAGCGYCGNTKCERLGGRTMCTVPRYPEDDLNR